MGEGQERHELFLSDYHLGKYPVTNAEYKRFIEAGGYQDKSFWTEAGWQEVGQKQNEPRYWQDARFNKPNQPAIGMSWYECVAYCRWLSAETGSMALNTPSWPRFSNCGSSCVLSSSRSILLTTRMAGARDARTCSNTYSSASVDK